MKAIQVMFDEKLLSRLDETAEVRKDGRSAVLRRAAALYLRELEEQEIDEAYRRGYADQPGLGEEFAGWEDEGVWPPD